ncbi:MAG TPA: DUF2071 domain-containing protein [Ktedonobacteraceae bacterium]|nr:DUF2071 domain-containing protein [Ktedonobacteraceae bacterium]
MDTRAILQAVEQRQYPLPRDPWIMTQQWHELIFAHWPVPLDMLRPLIPPLLDIDTFDDMAWIGVVPFHMSHVSPRGVPPVQGVSRFAELNVRTYVSVHGIPGVFFFCLDASNPIAVNIARRFFHLPYFNAIMTHPRERATTYYRSHRTHRGASPADFVAAYRPIAPVFTAQPGTLEYWLTERYSLYTVFREALYRGDIQHRPWPLQPAEMEIERNTMAAAHGITLPDTQPLLHYAELQEVLIWPLKLIG